MSLILSVVLPIFALILAGFLCRKRGILGPNASSELNRYVIYLALPALLFDVTAHSDWHTLLQPAFIGAYGLGTMASFGVAFALRRWQKRPWVDTSIDSLSASYANTGFIGIPLCTLALGPGSLQPAIISTILTVCVLFGCTIVLIEVGLHSETRIWPILRKVSVSLLRNPLLAAPMFGAAFAASGLHVPGAAQQFLKLLGASASPCALVGLGLFLASGHVRRETATMLALVAAKLVLQPLLTGWLAFRVFAMPPLWAASAVLLAALPTGTGPFMLTEYYRRDGAMISNVILVSTVISLVTVSLCLLILHR
jgi:malonate transporter and related proteins